MNQTDEITKTLAWRTGRQTNSRSRADKFPPKLKIPRYISRGRNISSYVKVNIRSVYFVFVPWECFVMRSVELYEKFRDATETLWNSPPKNCCRAMNSFRIIGFLFHNSVMSSVLYHLHLLHGWNKSCVW
jgi:hypothetical protein